MTGKRTTQQAKKESEQTVLRSLNEKSPQRWGELLKNTEISSRTLKKALERLEKRNMIYRKVSQVAEYPPPVLYGLSETGKETVNPLLLDADIKEVSQAVKNLENLTSSLTSNPSKLKKWYDKESEANWNELVNNPLNKSFQERVEEFEQKTNDLHRPIFDSMCGLHKIISCISLNQPDPNSFISVIKNCHVYLTPAELLQGLEFPFYLAYIEFPLEIIQEIQKRNAKLSDDIMELCGFKKEKNGSWVFTSRK